jgi:hypothetical protein
MLPKLALLGIATGTGGGWEESGHSWQESVPSNGGIGKNDSSDGIAVAFQRRCLNLRPFRTARLIRAHSTHSRLNRDRAAYIK